MWLEVRTGSGSDRVRRREAPKGNSPDRLVGDIASVTNRGPKGRHVHTGRSDLLIFTPT